jgi:hypothetical protein
MRRILNQAANAAVKTKGSIFQIVYRREVPRMGHNQTIGTIAHRFCRLIWILLYRKVRYEERGPEVIERSKRKRTESKRKRTERMVGDLRKLGYRVETASLQPVQLQ